MNPAIVAVALRSLPDADLASLAVHVDLRALSDATLAALAGHLETEPRARLAAALGEAMLSGVVSEAAPGSPVARRPRAATVPGMERPRGEKRPQSEIATIADEVLEALKLGEAGMETLVKLTKRPTKDLSLPIKKLLVAKAILSAGEKRATKYRLPKVKA